MQRESDKRVGETESRGVPDLDLTVPNHNLLLLFLELSLSLKINSPPGPSTLNISSSMKPF